jgi:hypothetical protein
MTAGASAPWWQRVGVALSGALLAVGGGSGVASLVGLLDGPDVKRQTCESYWGEIRDLREDGFRGFELMDDDAEVARRCGQPEDVARQW